MPSPDTLGHQEYRLIDASLNRTAEGLRYLEDIARFLLNDASLTGRFKSLRHRLVPADWRFQKQLLESRDASNDVGVGIKATGRSARHSLNSSVVANSRRAQEALRTLTEYARVITYSKTLTPEKLEKARFELYTLEKELTAGLLRQEKRKSIKGLYVIIDTRSLGKRTHTEVTLQAINSGAAVIQLRDKVHDRGELLPIALAMKKACAVKKVPFIVNDYLDLAIAAGADGVHVGQTDLPVPVVRKLAPMDMLVGCSVVNVEQAIKAAEDGADYVAPGAIFQTPTKESRALGLQLLKRVKKAVNVPVVAIGGINTDNIASIKKAGADSAAVISAALGAPSVENAVRKLSELFEGEK